MLLTAIASPTTITGNSKLSAFDLVVQRRDAPTGGLADANAVLGDMNVVVVTGAIHADEFVLRATPSLSVGKTPLLEIDVIQGGFESSIDPIDGETVLKATSHPTELRITASMSGTEKRKTVVFGAPRVEVYHQPTSPVAGSLLAAAHYTSEDVFRFTGATSQLDPVWFRYGNVASVDRPSGVFNSSGINAVIQYYGMNRVQDITEGCWVSNNYRIVAGGKTHGIVIPSYVLAAGNAEYLGSDAQVWRQPKPSSRQTVRILPRPIGEHVPSLVNRLNVLPVVGLVRNTFQTGDNYWFQPYVYTNDIGSVARAPLATLPKTHYSLHAIGPSMPLLYGGDSFSPFFIPTQTIPVFVGFASVRGATTVPMYADEVDAVIARMSTKNGQPLEFSARADFPTYG